MYWVQTINKNEYLVPANSKREAYLKMETVNIPAPDILNLFSINSHNQPMRLVGTLHVLSENYKGD